jgi:hypothetical protein
MVGSAGKAAEEGGLLGREAEDDEDALLADELEPPMEGKAEVEEVPARTTPVRAEGVLDDPPAPPPAQGVE